VVVRDYNAGEDNALLLEISDNGFRIARVDYDGRFAVSDAPYVIVGKCKDGLNPQRRH
jgi:hypothetical protein